MFKLSENMKGFKKKEITSSISIHLFRVSGLFLARVLFRTGITPNQITWISFFLKFPVAFLFILADYKYLIMGAIILYISVILDYTDGSLARMRKKSTKYGYFLDSTLDMIGVVILLLAISFGLYINIRIVLIWIFGFLAVSSILVRELIYEFFTKSFSQAYNLFEMEKKKRKFLKNFSYEFAFLYVFMLIGALFNSLYLFLMFCAIYGWIFNFIFFGMLLRKVSRIEDKK